MYFFKYPMQSYARYKTAVGFYGSRGLSIGVMVFILYKLYVLLPYTYPTPKPLTGDCASPPTLYDL